MSEEKLTITQIAPLLRGMSFDGEKGMIVHASPTIAAEATVRALGGQTVSLDGVEPEGLSERLEAALRGSNGAGLPPVIACPSVATFFIAPTYDEAVRLKRSVESGERPAVTEGGEEPSGQGAPYSAALRSRVVLNKISVVTGGAQGFGEEIVRHLVEGGSLVFIADLNLQGAERLAEELNRDSGRTAAVPVAVDIGSEESVREMIDAIVAEAGGIDLFVSNAGVLKAGSVKELAAKDFEFVTQVNYVGFFLCAKWASRVMALQNRPSGRYYTDILQINSKSGLEGSNKNGAYAGSKFGGIGLAQSFALELVADNIKVNAICPGNFLDGPLWSDPDRGLFVQYLKAGKVPGATTVADVKRYYEERVPMRRGCTGVDVIKAIYYVIEQKYETGQAIPVTGGQVMLS